MAKSCLNVRTLPQPPWRPNLARKLHSPAKGLWNQLCGHVSPSRHLCWPHSQGRKARRSSGHAADQIRAVINMKTAKALGIEVPISMQMLADEVIE